MTGPDASVSRTSAGELRLQERFNDGAMWVETDPDNNLSQTAPKSQWTTLRRDHGSCQLIRDNGAGSIPSVFDYFFELEIEAMFAGDADDRALVYPLVINNRSFTHPYAAPFIATTVYEDGNDDAQRGQPR